MSTATVDPTTSLANRKQVRYDRETRDYTGLFDGTPICFGRTHDEARQKLDAYVYDLLVRSTVPPEGPHVITEAANAHAMYLDGQLIGVARTFHEAQVTLGELMDEIAQQTAIVSADIAADRAALLREVAL